MTAKTGSMVATIAAKRSRVIRMVPPLFFGNGGAAKRRPPGHTSASLAESVVGPPAPSPSVNLRPPAKTTRSGRCKSVQPDAR